MSRGKGSASCQTSRTVGGSGTVRFQSGRLMIDAQVRVGEAPSLRHHWQAAPGRVRPQVTGFRYALADERGQRDRGGGSRVEVDRLQNPGDGRKIFLHARGIVQSVSRGPDAEATFTEEYSDRVEAPAGQEAAGGPPGGIERQGGILVIRLVPGDPGPLLLHDGVPGFAQPLGLRPPESRQERKRRAGELIGEHDGHHRQSRGVLTPPRSCGGDHRQWILGGARLRLVRDRGTAGHDLPIPREADREPALGVGDRPHPGLGPDGEHRRQDGHAADQDDQPTVSHRGESIASARPDNSPPNTNYHFGRGRFSRSDARDPTVQTINGSENPPNYVRETSRRNRNETERPASLPRGIDRKTIASGVMRCPIRRRPSGSGSGRSSQTSTSRRDGSGISPSTNRWPSRRPGILEPAPTGRTPARFEKRWRTSSHGSRNCAAWSPRRSLQP